ncbi:beta-glucuronosyltransferase GlcAT14B [Argentina anserina]|uniref:beta-glucuronosyltransferase GlcAT14B n=1 Tax=Argentina anserina TaxID=57926 RepID=UPI00217647C0|nr:beta-glucuronosyltransferase GlcAT14B [Potentilla anserina]
MLSPSSSTINHHTHRLTLQEAMQHSDPPPQPPPQQPPLLSSSSSFSSSLFKDHPTIFASSLFALLLLFITLSSSPYSSSPLPSLSSATRPPDPFLFPTRQSHRVVYHDNNSSDPTPPSLAYLISGSKGDLGPIVRLLHATYHPRNQYLLHLDRFASDSDRDKLALKVISEPIFRAAQNVHLIGKADIVYPKGSSPISFTLHGASILLRLSANWDWFISLTVNDYPLLNQDDLLHIMSFLPKDLNFVNHSSYIGWKEAKRLKPVIVDPGLYRSEPNVMFYAAQKRVLPNAYRLFTGASFNILSRNFMEFCIVGIDNLPRTLLMYFANTASSLSDYFPTVICNSRQFNKTILNHNLLYANGDTPLKEKPPPHNSNDFDVMVQNGAAFATGFRSDDPILDRIDREILKRHWGKVVPGGWCLGGFGNDTCSVWGDADILRPSPRARSLEKLLVGLLSNGTFHSRQCIYE